MSLRLRSSGGGSVTLQEPVTSIDSTINLPSANAALLASQLTGSALTAPNIEYDGTTLYYTPSGTLRGVAPSMQFFKLGVNLAGANTTAVQNVFGVGVTLQSNTAYAFEIMYNLSKASGQVSHTHSIAWGGTLTTRNVGYVYQVISTGSGTAVNNTWNGNRYSSTSFANQVTTAAITNIGQNINIIIKGTIETNTGGTLIPQYVLSAAPNGAYTTEAGSYMLIYPIGTSGSNTSVGTWA